MGVSFEPSQLELLPPSAFGNGRLSRDPVIDTFLTRKIHCDLCKRLEKAERDDTGRLKLRCRTPSNDSNLSTSLIPSPKNPHDEVGLSPDAFLQAVNGQVYNPQKSRVANAIRVWTAPPNESKTKDSETYKESPWEDPKYRSLRSSAEEVDIPLLDPLQPSGVDLLNEARRRTYNWPDKVLALTPEEEAAFSHKYYWFECCTGSRVRTLFNGEHLLPKPTLELGNPLFELPPKSYRLPEGCCLSQGIADALPSHVQTIQECKNKSVLLIVSRSTTATTPSTELIEPHLPFAIYVSHDRDGLPHRFETVLPPRYLYIKESTTSTGIRRRVRKYFNPFPRSETTDACPSFD